MALVKKLMYFRSQSGFEEQLNAGNVADESICFIKASEAAPLANSEATSGDSVPVNKIWTHGQYFGDLTQAYSYIQKLQDEIGGMATSNELSKIQSALDELEKTVEGKQDTLTSANAGTGISITTGSSGTAVISATVDLSGYYTKSQTDSAISSAVAAVTLTAGDNISISGNAISVSGFAANSDITALFA